jgi:hypothetical protein
MTMESDGMIVVRFPSYSDFQATLAQLCARDEFAVIKCALRCVFPREVIREFAGTRFTPVDLIDQVVDLTNSALCQGAISEDAALDVYVRVPEILTLLFPEAHEFVTAATDYLIQAQKPIPSEGDHVLTQKAYTFFFGGAS